MRITGFRIHPIAIADPPLRSSYGLHAPYALRTIIELESDDHIIGISETYGGKAQVEQLEALRPRIFGRQSLSAHRISLTDGGRTRCRRSDGSETL